MPTALFFAREIKAAVYLQLDRSKLPNLKNMNAALMAKAALRDPANAHGIIYMWGTVGIRYNEQMIKALPPNAPLDSWRMVFNQAVTSVAGNCGISILDAPAQMMRAVLPYIGKDPTRVQCGSLQARDGAREANRGIEIKYTVPKQGSVL